MSFLLKQLSNLKEFARFSHKEYRQYDGYFDNWILARSVTSGRYKGGSVLAKDREVLASPDLLTWYDPDTQHVCAVRPGELVKLT